MFKYIISVESELRVILILIFSFLLVGYMFFNNPTSSCGSCENGDLASASAPFSNAANMRRYHNSYLSLVFTKTIINGEEHSQCVICLVVLASDIMKPNTLKKHFDTQYKDLTKNSREIEMHL